MIVESQIITSIKKGFTKEQIKKEMLDANSKQAIEIFYPKLLSTLDKIADLALRDFSNEEIGNILGMSTINVSKYLNCLIQKESSLYNDEIAQKIKKLQENKSIQKNLEMYKKMMILDEKKCDLNDFATKGEIINFEKIKQKITVLKEFIKNGCVGKIEDFASQYKVSKNGLEEILCKRDRYQIIENFLTKEEQDEIMIYIEKRRQLILQAKISRNTQEKKSKEDYSKLYQRIDYWCQIVLTYRLSLYNLGKILNYQDRSELKRIMLNNCPSHYRIGLKYLFEEEKAYVDFLRDKNNLTEVESKKIEEDNAIRNQYYDDINFVTCCQMCGNTEDEKYQEIMHRLTDYDYKKTIQKHLKTGVAWSEDDIANVVKYKIKYCLTFKNIPACRSVISERCPEYLKKEFTNCNAYRDEFFIRTLKRDKKGNKNA